MFARDFSIQRGVMSVRAGAEWERHNAKVAEEARLLLLEPLLPARRLRLAADSLLKLFLLVLQVKAAGGWP